MSERLLITFNAGSSTVKIGLFALESGAARRIGKGMIDFRRTPLRLRLSEGPDVFDAALDTPPGSAMHDVLREAFGRLAWRFDFSQIDAIGHRVVHGGDAFSGAARIDPGALAQLERLTTLAPLHQPQALKLIRAIERLRPEMPQTASFDTAFHRSNADLTRRFALPRALHEDGVKRYGFHGLSYKFIAGELARRNPKAAESKVVAAHLGSGASLCAIENGVSRDSSMGFSTLDGIPMATRCGALDAGVLLHLLGEQKRSLKDVEDLLYHCSGLLGVSGVSADTRELLASDRPEAKEALELFAFRVGGEVARLAATLGGLDALVFTAGVGENQPEIRASIAKRLAWLGLSLDEAANAGNAELISAPDSRIAAFVIPTDEEQVIADEAVSLLSTKD